MSTSATTEDFFRVRLEHMIDLRHPLAMLASRMPWAAIEASVMHLFARRTREGEDVGVSDVDLFGVAPAVLVGAGISNAGRPRLPVRLMVSLLYLKHAFNVSDEALVERWSDAPLWPCDPSSIGKFRRLLGEEGIEELLAQTINAAVNLKLIVKAELARVVVDSTVQQKAVAYPTDSQLLETARAKLVEAAREAGVELKQTFAKEARSLRYKAGRYAHARQFKRMRRAIQRQRTIVARLQREIERKAGAVSQAVGQALQATL